MDASHASIRKVLGVLVVLRLSFIAFAFLSGLLSGFFEDEDAKKCLELLERAQGNPVNPLKGGSEVARCWCLHDPNGPSLATLSPRDRDAFASFIAFPLLLDAVIVLTVMLLIDRKWLLRNILIVIVVFSTLLYDPVLALALFAGFVLAGEHPDPRAEV